MPRNESSTATEVKLKPGRESSAAMAMMPNMPGSTMPCSILLAGSIARDETADANAKAKGGEQVAAVGFIDVENVGGVKNDVEQQQGAQEPEEGVGEDGDREDVVEADAAKFGDEFAGHVPVEAARGIGGGQAGDPQADEEAGDGEREEEDSRPDLAAAKMCRQEAPGERGEDCGEQRGELDDAVAPAEFGFGQELGEQSVLGGAEERALRAGEKQGDAGEVEAIAGERQRCQAHDDELEELGAEGDVPLAVFVGEVAAGNGEKQKRDGEEQGHDEDEPQIALLFGEGGFQDEEADQPFEGVVAEGVLELNGDERPEAAESARWRRGGGASGAGVFRGIGHALAECSCDRMCWARVVGGAGCERAADLSARKRVVDGSRPTGEEGVHQQRAGSKPG